MKTEIMDYDLIIVGAGPAGLSAAREAKALGINYLLIDSKKRLGYPLKCAEGIEEEFFVEFFGKKEFSFVKNTVLDHKITYKDLTRTLPANFLQLDRPQFEAWLGKGLNILMDCSCSDVISSEDIALVKTSKGEMRAKIVIYCVGARYDLQKKLCIMPKNSAIAIGYGGIFKNYSLSGNPSSQHCVHESFHYIFDDEFSGYLWIFPKSKSIANIGIAFDPRLSLQKNPKIFLKNMMEKYSIHGMLIKEYGGLIPCFGPITSCSQRILFAGDAAGFVYAGTGEGIQYALRSGKIAASVAARAIKNTRYDKNYLSQYGRECKKEFGREMKAGLMFLDLVVAASRLGKVKGLFSRPSNGEISDLVLHGRYPLKAYLAWKIVRLLGLHKVKSDVHKP